MYDVVESTRCQWQTSVLQRYLHLAVPVQRALWRLLVAMTTYRVWSLGLRHTVADVLLVAMETAASANVSSRKRL